MRPRKGYTFLPTWAAVLSAIIIYMQFDTNIYRGPELRGGLSLISTSVRPSPPSLTSFLPEKTLTSLQKPEFGMGRTWEKFSSLPANKPQKFETATGKENFLSNRGGSHQWEFYSFCFDTLELKNARYQKTFFSSSSAPLSKDLFPPFPVSGGWDR